MSARQSVRRWFVFNGVGAGGLVVQIAVLAALVRLTPVHYLAATALGVEAAVLHNFAWHQRWTWRDRPVTTTRARMARLARFHLTNGAVSLMGNLAIVRLLTGALHVDPILANLAAVGICSLVNFAASDALVFRTAGTVVLVILAQPRAFADAAGPAGAPATATLRQETIAAWNAYERQVDERYGALTASTVRFFARDAFGVDAGWRAAALAGDVPMLQIHSASPGLAEPNVPDGRIHHWIGAVFVRGVTLDRVLAALRDRAGRESEVYDDVPASRLIRRDGDRFEVYMKLRRVSVLTVTYNTTHVVEYRRAGGTRATSRSVATRIVELENAGTAAEREKASGTDRGFLWRLDAFWRYEETNGGVLVECESVSLSRTVPLLLRPFITRAVEGVARDALEHTLLNLKRVLTSSSR